MISRTTIAAATLLFATQAAQAEHRDFGETPGRTLALVESCARHVSVTVDPGLSGRVALSADAANPQEIDQIGAAEKDGAARIGLKPGLQECWRPSENVRFKRTLVLSLRIPAGSDVSISESGFGDYALGAVGALTMEVSGLTMLTAESVTGNVRLNMSGAGKVTLDRVDASRVAAELSGAGEFRVKDGRIGDLTVDDSGAATVSVTPAVENAKLSISGVGDIAVGGVRGQLTRSTSGLGRIVVAGRPTATTQADDDVN
ncbi:DUF2807 domain-containing protein [Acetobacteraceae bacterium KSS8]|uniref:DUF2807 domain-containing protein n=1 Tax=Endosaccharibacter trunci TaxID=2812733 RepID=A0ABT1W2D7_9PROT|nr:DUF2807 domain-containing protein [Acetobacteraceae bacterium KSS8]